MMGIEFLLFVANVHLAGTRDFAREVYVFASGMICVVLACGKPYVYYDPRLHGEPRTVPDFGDLRLGRDPRFALFWDLRTQADDVMQAFQNARRIIGARKESLQAGWRLVPEQLPHEECVHCP